MAEAKWPRRIACITSETTEIVFALGAGERIVGVSGFSVRPPEAREKEKVSSFTSIKMEKIRELNPDLIIGFSDLQKDIARELIENGYTVLITNQRTLEETGDAVLAIGRILGEESKAEALRVSFFKELEDLARGSRERLAAEGARPRVYFEEWDGPLITGISWVSELIEKFGGEDVFKTKSAGKVAKQRNVTPEEVIAADPDMIIASWCGKKAQLDKIAARPGWDQIHAVKNQRLYEIKSADILAPGLSLLHGARQLAEIFKTENLCRTI
jgi:iron complex transport system substrate-binding protein